MRGTNPARTSPGARVVSYPHQTTPDLMELGKDGIEQVRLSFFTETPGGISANVSHLHQAGQLAINKERCFHQEPYLICPRRAAFMEDTHKGGYAGCSSGSLLRGYRRLTTFASLSFPLGFEQAPIFGELPFRLPP